MDPSGPILRLCGLAVFVIAFGLTFVPHFVEATAAADFGDGSGSFKVSDGISAWHGFGGFGALLLVAAVGSLGAGLELYRAGDKQHQIPEFIAVGVTLTSAVVLAIYVATRDSGGSSSDGFEIHIGLGWSGIAAFVLLAIGGVVALVAALSPVSTAIASSGAPMRTAPATPQL